MPKKSLVDDLAESVPPGPPVETARFEENGDTAKATFVTSDPIRTQEDAIRAGKIDLSVWFVRSCKWSAWTVPIKLRGGRHGRDEAIQTQQYRVALDLQRIAPKPILAALDALYDRIATRGAKRKAPTRRAASGEPVLAVFAAFDAHFGKLCWAKETGDNYDLRIAEEVYRNAVHDAIAESNGRPIGRVLIPVGNDFFHIDNSRNTTYAGTPLDVDGRYAKIIESGEMAMANAIEAWRGIAPVDVVWIPGNHDPTTSFHLARFLDAYFRNDDAVTVDYGPSPRKYVTYGKTLLLLTHGDQEKKEALPGLMAGERPKEWAEATCRECLVGHDHRIRKWMTQPIETFDGVVVRALQSIAGTDSWHHRRGYRGSGRKAAEVLYYGLDRGFSGLSVLPARFEGSP